MTKELNADEMARLKDGPARRAVPLFPVEYRQISLLKDDIKALEVPGGKSRCAEADVLIHEWAPAVL